MTNWLLLGLDKSIEECEMVDYMYKMAMPEIILHHCLKS